MTKSCVKVIYRQNYISCELCDISYLDDNRTHLKMKLHMRKAHNKTLKRETTFPKNTKQLMCGKVVPDDPTTLRPTKGGASLPPFKSPTKGGIGGKATHLMMNE